MTIVAVTGHRDKNADPAQLRAILQELDATLLVHGAAAGFDQQAAAAAAALGIPTQAIPPDYATYGRAAPLIRNREIVDRGEVLIACYDGRGRGGTYQTIRYATSRHIPIHTLTPDTTPQK